MHSLMSTVLRPQIISRSLAPNSHHQHKPFPQMFSVFNPWEGLGSSDIMCFPLTRREPSLRTESWNATERERHVPEARAKMFSWETYSRLHHPVPWVTHSLLLPCLGAGRQDLGSLPAATQWQTLTQSVSNLALPVDVSLKGMIWP